jgi:hypothetical protein
MKHFVLVAADSDRNRTYLPSAHELATYRLSRKEWGLKVRTRNRGKMTEGDKVLIYLSGSRDFSQHFVASATLASSPIQNRSYLVDSPVAFTSVCSEYKVLLKDVVVFSNPVGVRELITTFEFIKPEHQKMWRIYFQGGALSIPKSDFALVVNKAKK